ncbi:ATP-dependent DNA helicase [Pediococcus ethanolidurans]|uniref:ATP-dependent DNA helicase n=1 Tax=Pediococcus ethanolidurans TaxID=319653 RepID=UPI0021A9EBCC|nr:ATP-dependent DNA helicase [Pediococcus ethanolidurans]MCT4397615.1 ATP-dependent DNA helicase [Pediococcus ethanolidurans]
MANNKIGIRQLVEFVLRAGDLSSSSNSQNTALEGARIHRKLQKTGGENYEKEVYVKRTVTMADEEYVIDGRADGVIQTSDSLLIEEIKTSDPDFEDLSENTLTLYWSQAKAYGAILTHDLDMLEVTIRLTYYQRTTDKITKTEHTYQREDLQTFFDGLIEEYRSWLVMRSDWRKKRNESIQKLAFPFKEYRNGQRDLAVAVYKTVALKKRLFVEAPTGTGKTISTLFPSVKAMGEGLSDRLFYLTAKQSTRSVAEKGLQLMVDKGMQIKSITLTAKDKIIFPEEVDVAPEDNPYMIGYYDRLKDGIRDVFEHENQIVRPTIEKYAKKHMLDPFEFSLDISTFMDVIICDYNYLFDPIVYLQRFFSQPDDSNFFLVDEAHNLVSRSRDMYTAQVDDRKIDNLLAAGKTANKNEDVQGISKQLKKVQTVFDQVKLPLDEQHETQAVTTEELTGFRHGLEKFNTFVQDWLAKQEPTPFTSQILDFYFTLLRYVKISAFYDESYRVIVTINDDQSVSVKELCLDPSPYLDMSLKMGRGVVFFSATLSPMDYFKETLGCETTGLSLQLTSPFLEQRQNILITQYVNTTYKQRDNSVQSIVTSIFEMVNAKKGNYLIFCPSYKYMTQIENAFLDQYQQFNVIEQSNQMDETARKDFLDAFAKNYPHSLIGFSVLGGIFSEGIDLVGDHLIGVAIVSVGLPGLSDERNLLRDYFDQKNGKGFEYAYQLPGMNHVLQAAGRLIRSNQDAGNVLLMDNRFGSQRYTRLFPRHWQHYQRMYSIDQLGKNISNFWQRLSEN